MLRVMIALLLVLCSIISVLDRKDVNAATPQASKTSMQVLVKFGGLLVFAPSLTGGYDVGVLINTKDVAPGHHLEVSKFDGTLISLPRPTEVETWSLSITGSKTGVAPTRRGPDVTDRRRDTQLGQHDISWSIDLQKLHPKAGFRLIRGRLSPVIHLNNGALYSLYKTEFMQSVQGGSVPADFGFLTETVGLQLELQEGQDLILTQDETGTELYRWRYDPAPGPAYQIAIRNVRDAKDPHHDDSDFKYYYRIFEGGGVPAPMQYDFQLKPGSNPRPFNPVPRPPSAAILMKQSKTDKIRPLTCCGLDCNPTFLSGTYLR